MVARPREEVIHPEEVGVYHCWSRCVRRAFLCGQDRLTGQDYEYRRDWIRDFEETLAGLFAIDIGFHSELSNHIHLVVRNRPEVVAQWPDREVAERWLRITHVIKSKDGQTKQISAGQIALEIAKPGRLDVLRRRLADPSFFMAALCEHVGRRGNREDKQSGHFWEDRFGCRNLDNDASILVCGIYVDLNQIRAGETTTPEASTHTSAYDRIRARLESAAGELAATRPDGWLCELTLEQGLDADVREGVLASTSRRASDKGLLPIKLDDYLRLLDYSGRALREGKSGAIPADLAPILERLGIQTSLWTELVTHFHEWFGPIVGASRQLAERAVAAGRRWYRGQQRCAAAFG